MKNKRPEILAYYFPNWHVDPLNEKWHGKGWTEWNVTKYATPRFPGHRQPKVPLMGYEDEADPAVMERQIETAVSHGVDGFMFDWYYYEGVPYRNRCLEEGLMKAANVDKIKFAVMWCNHDAIQAHPGCRAFPAPVLASGKVTPEIFRSVTQYCIEHYFAHPSYLRVDGKPVFSIYNLKKMVGELGVETMCVLLDEFRSRVRQAGLGELHLNSVHVGYQYDNGKPNSDQVNALLLALGVNSRSGHSWSWSRTRTDLPCEDYGAAAEENIARYRNFSQDFELSYNPVMMVGWDASPRTLQSDIFDPSVGYPFSTILTDSTPAQFEKYLRKAKEFIESDAFTGKFLMLHSWNEWTEGTYLLPSEEYGSGHLEAIRKVFGPVRS